MATIIKCDRCGDTYPKSEPAGKIISPKIANVWLDLCARCWEEYSYWVFHVVREGKMESRQISEAVNGK